MGFPILYGKLKNTFREAISDWIVCGMMRNDVKCYQIASLGLVGFLKSEWDPVGYHWRQTETGYSSLRRMELP